MMDSAVLRLCYYYFTWMSYFDQLPDGRVIKVGTERFQAPEALFTPVSCTF